MMASLVPQEIIESKIYLIRGKKVMLDKDLAILYKVSTKALNQAVKRNYDRFPSDFMFQLTKEEAYSLRSQFVTLKRGHHIKYFPYVFTEQGVAMLSSVLNSKRAVQVNIQIMRIFIKLREIIINNKEILERLKEIESKVNNHDEEIKSIFNAIKELINGKVNPKRKIGFCIE